MKAGRYIMLAAALMASYFIIIEVKGAFNRQQHAAYKGRMDNYDRTIAEERQQKREEREERRTKQHTEKQIKQELITASDKDLMGLLGSCRTKIDEYANKSNKSAFSITMLTEYAGPTYVIAAGPKAMVSDEKRITRHRNLVNEHDLVSFNTEHAVLIVNDSFSGLYKTVHKYSCEIGPGLSVISVSESK